MALSRPICGRRWATSPRPATNRPAGPGWRLLVGALLFGSALLLAGCATLKDPEAAQEYGGDVVARLQPGETVGQTLVSRRSGFNGVQLWLRQVTPPAGDEAVITASLYHRPGETQPLAVTAVRFARLSQSFPITINFPAQADPPGQAYYLELSVVEGEADLYGRAEDADPHGSLYRNGAATPADAAFRLSYAYATTELLIDLRRALNGAWLVLPLVLIMWAPGRLVLWPLLSARRMDWGVRTALAVGMSQALIPLVMLWTTTVGLRWGRIGVLVVLGLAALALAGLFWRDLRRQGLRRPHALDLALAAVLVFTLALRLVMIRDLAAPAWVDPVHHAAITRLIMQEGGLPASYAQFVEAGTANYHPGFHAATALFVWLSGLEIADAMLLFGQVQNALCGLAVYLLAVTLTRDRLVGVLAALAAGVFSPMPAYYVSWGRYTQLAGLLILPACIDLILRVRQAPPGRKLPLGLAATLACAGLALTHYRVIAYLGIWLTAYVVAEVVRTLARRPLWQTVAELGAHIGAIAVAAVLLTLPWWPEVFSSLLAPAVASFQPRPPNALRLDWAYLTPANGRTLLWLALGGLLASIVRRGWFGPTLALWVGLMFIGAGQGLIRLPLAGSVNKTAVEIMLFMPAAVLAAYLVGWLSRGLDRQLPRPARGIYRLGAAALLAALALANSPHIVALLNPVTVLARAADRPAWEWMAANLPEDATVLINPFLWGYGVYAGQDGGYWVTPAAGLRSMPPVALYGLERAAAFEQVTAISQAALAAGKDPPKLHALMQQHGIDYVYLGRRGGAISPQALRASPLFRVLYTGEGVWLFALNDD